MKTLWCISNKCHFACEKTNWKTMIQLLSHLTVINDNLGLALQWSHNNFLQCSPEENVLHGAEINIEKENCQRTNTVTSSWHCSKTCQHKTIFSLFPSVGSICRGLGRFVCAGAFCSHLSYSTCFISLLERDTIAEKERETTERQSTYFLHARSAKRMLWTSWPIILTFLTLPFGAASFCNF